MGKSASGHFKTSIGSIFQTTMGKSEADTRIEATNGCTDVARSKTGINSAIGSRTSGETGAFHAGITSQ